MPPTPPAPAARFIVLFDGECVLCNHWARFIAARDPRCQFALGQLQSETGARLLAEHGVPADQSSIVLLGPAGVARKSDAILRILAQLPMPWRLAAVGWVVPRFIRDAAYDFVAAHRYRWFGRDEACALPTAAVRARLLT